MMMKGSRRPWQAGTSAGSCADVRGGRAGGRDKLADPEDVRTLAAALAPGVVVHAHQEPGYEHMDFVWGNDAHLRVYPHVLALLAAHA